MCIPNTSDDAYIFPEIFLSYCEKTYNPTFFNVVVAKSLQTRESIFRIQCPNKTKGCTEGIAFQIFLLPHTHLNVFFFKTPCSRSRREIFHEDLYENRSRVPRPCRSRRVELKDGYEIVRERGARYISKSLRRQALFAL